MKAFFASLLASATMAANTMTWIGTKATAGDLGAIPKGTSSWSGTSSEVAVTWTTTVRLTNKMANDDYVQSWYCMGYDGKTDCNLWQWEMDGTAYVITGKNYTKSDTTTKDSSIPAEKPMAWFDDNYYARYSVEYIQSADNVTPVENERNGFIKGSKFRYSSSKVNGK